MTSTLKSGSIQLLSHNSERAALNHGDFRMHVDGDVMAVGVATERWHKGFNKL